MAGVPGMQTKNKSGAGSKATNFQLVKPFPWESRTANIEKWTQQRIFKFLAKTLEKWGVTRDKSASDLVSHLADHHWMRMLAMEAIKNNEMMLGKNPFNVVSSSRAAILSAYRGLGLHPLNSVKELIGDDDDDDSLDFT